MISCGCTQPVILCYFYCNYWGGGGGEKILKNVWSQTDMGRKWYLHVSMHHVVSVVFAPICAAVAAISNHGSITDRRDEGVNPTLAGYQ